MQEKRAGKLIVIEGLDGSGKSTQWEMLKKSRIYNKVMFITFPDYESESGKIIKRYLSGEFNDNPEYSAYSASSFYAVDRYISNKTSWGEAHRNGSDIISARYTSSNAIYQMTKLHESKWKGYLDWLYDYEYCKLGIPEPDLTVFLDVPIEISQDLLVKRYSDSGEKDIHEENVTYLHECRKAALYAAEIDNWVLIDCIEEGTGRLRSPEDINCELSRIIGDCLNAGI